MMGAGTNKEQKEEGKKNPLWMVTFADMATLLLAFFILLLSMSSMDAKTLKNNFSNFTSSSGIALLKNYEAIYKPKETLIADLQEALGDRVVIMKKDDPAEVVDSRKDEKVRNDMSGSIILKNTEDGFKLIFGQQILFLPGSAEIKDEIKPVLKRIGRFILSTNYQLFIDGHTDNSPLHGTGYRDNNELSLARAFHVLDYFVKEEKVPPGSMALAGYGESHPAGPNDTTIGRANNRRVELIFKNREFF